MTSYGQAVAAFAASKSGWPALLDRSALAAAERAAAFADNAVARGETVLPAPADLLRALVSVPLERVKVVILGQDPYPTPGDADGLAFSTAPGRRIPKSLANIFRELADDIGVARPASGSLALWAEQGVLLLNSCLTVPAGRAGGHRGEGWEELTRGVLKAVASRAEPTVFILWGADAQRQMAGLDTGRHTLITGAHPSPLSAYRGFFGSRPFGKANAALRSGGAEPVNWSL
jgi:uracil-DNA glycosylase